MMMNPKNHNLIISFHLVTFACIFGIGVCQDLSSYPCVTKLIPCQDSLLAPSKPPPNSCCKPLNQLLASKNDTKCLCSVLDDPNIMESFNVTKGDALKLAKACGAKKASHLCQSAPSPSSPPRHRSNGTSPPSIGFDTNPFSAKSGATGMIPFYHCSSLIVLGLVLLLSV